ncbi:MAG: WD40 repeat domain-containing protein [Candidatus Dormibacteria bacterium]
MVVGTTVFSAVSVSVWLVIGLGHTTGRVKESVAERPSSTVANTPVAAPTPAFAWTPYPGKPSASPYVPPATAQVESTVKAPPPLIVTYDMSEKITATSPARYIARNYQGQVVGSITIDQAAQAAGVLVSPDGSKLLIGDLVFSIYGHELADLYSATYPNALVQPIWADDSNHLCGIASGNSTGQVRGALLEFSAAGGMRIIAQLGPLSGTGGGWSVLACSPTADRAVVWQQQGSHSEILVMRLSTGQLLATYDGGASGDGPGAASHNGSFVAINGSDGVTILNTVTGRQVATVSRWGNTMGYPAIGQALAFSWDGSRLLLQSDIAQGGPYWIVAWSTNTNLVTSQSMSLANVMPLIRGATMFIQDPTSPYTAYLLENNGGVSQVP